MRKDQRASICVPFLIKFAMCYIPNMYMGCSGVNLQKETNSDIYSHLPTLSQVISGCCKFVMGHHLCLFKIYNKEVKENNMSLDSESFLSSHILKPFIISFRPLDRSCKIRMLRATLMMEAWLVKFHIQGPYVIV